MHGARRLGRLTAATTAMLALAAPADAASIFALRDSTFNPVDVASGSHGTLWVSSDSPLSAIKARYAIAHVNLAGHYKLITVPAPTSAIAVSRTGTVFASEAERDGVVIISPSGKVSEASLPTSDSAGGAVTVGPDGNAWVVENGPNQVARVTPSGAVSEFPVPPEFDPEYGEAVQATPGAITTARDGRMWLAIRHGVATVGTDGTVTEHLWALDPPAEPAAIAAAPDGTLWTGEREAGRLEHTGPSGDDPAVLPGPDEPALSVAPSGTLSAFSLADPTRTVLTGSGASRTQTLVVHDVPGERDTVRAESLRSAAPGPAGLTWLSAHLTDQGGGDEGAIVVLDDSGRCVVPDLVPDDVAAAKAALTAHSCRLGKVARHNRLHLATRYLRVTRQGVKAGSRRPHGARVAITLKG
jgi:streptogramin lyase